MIDKDLENIHKLLLVIAEEIKRICEKHNIKYFIIAGTALGAIRHKGFIPWDEDMDIGMLRGDYDRFVAACREELDGKFFFQDIHTDRYYPSMFSKIVLKDTIYQEIGTEKSKAINGIFVDIFPFDKVPNDETLKAKTEVSRRRVNQLLRMHCNYETGARSKLMYGMTMVLAKLMPKFLINTIAEYVYKKYNGIKAKEVVTAEGSYGYTKEIIPIDYTRQLIDVPFEDTTFPVFKDYDGYLEGMYGDYMVIPPSGNREKHHLAKLDYSKYIDEVS
jgi:LPS biosynthesis protein